METAGSFLLFLSNFPVCVRARVRACQNRLKCTDKQLSLSSFLLLLLLCCCCCFHCVYYDTFVRSETWGETSIQPNKSLPTLDKSSLPRVVLIDLLLLPRIFFQFIHCSPIFCSLGPLVLSPSSCCLLPTQEIIQSSWYMGI